MYLFLLFQQQYLQLKYPNRSYLLLYKTKDRYSIFPMNIDLFLLKFRFIIYIKGYILCLDYLKRKRK